MNNKVYTAFAISSLFSMLTIAFAASIGKGEASQDMFYMAYIAFIFLWFLAFSFIHYSELIEFHYTYFRGHPAPLTDEVIQLLTKRGIYGIGF